MTVRGLTCLVTAALYGLAAGCGASAEVKRGPVAAPPAMTKSLPLTEGECRGLGGKIAETVFCIETGQSCTTVDKNGVVRTKCITGKQE